MAKTTITPEIIAEVKKYASKYPEMPQMEIAKLVGISQTGVSAILRGLYDEKPNKIESQIPYETYRRLVMCEEAINEIFRNTKTAFQEEELLLVDYRTVSSILKRFFPEEFEERLNAIKE